MKLEKAQRKNTRLKIGLSGASGSGKTYSALLLAYGITRDWSKVAVIDTENGSSNLYAHLGDFRVYQMKPPYSPSIYIKAIKACENAAIEVIIIDSITHEWKGVGGCLNMHSKLGGRFQDWTKVTPIHNEFIEAILASDSHIITTVRRRIEYVVSSDEYKKLKVVKLGTKEETRNGFEYELTVNFELIVDKHIAKATKDRTGLFDNRTGFVINSSTGEKLVQWSKSEMNFKQISNSVTTQ